MLGIAEELNRGEMCINGLVVTKLPSLKGIDVGWGLFTDTDDEFIDDKSQVECNAIHGSKVAIRKGAYIGEYLGVLYAKTTSPSGGLSCPDTLSTHPLDIDINILFLHPLLTLTLTHTPPVTNIKTSTSTPTDYAMFYPSSDGGYEIDAKEYGNLTRFINHSTGGC